MMPTGKVLLLRQSPFSRHSSLRQSVLHGNKVQTLSISCLTHPSIFPTLRLAPPTCSFIKSPMAWTCSGSCALLTAMAFLFATLSSFNLSLAFFLEGNSNEELVHNLRKAGIIVNERVKNAMKSV